MKTLVAALVAAIGVMAGGARAETISLSPTTQTIASGSPETLDLNISGLSSTTALGAFDVSVNFDSSILSFNNATFGDPVLGDQLDLMNLGLNGPIAAVGTGTVDLSEVDLFDSPSTLSSSQARSFTLAAISFDAVASGTTPLTITVNSLADQNGDPFTALTQNASVTAETSTSPPPSPIPEPSSPFLLVSALIALLALARVR